MPKTPEIGFAFLCYGVVLAGGDGIESWPQCFPPFFIYVLMKNKD